jgi:hypothetical protein
MPGEAAALLCWHPGLVEVGGGLVQGQRQVTEPPGRLPGVVLGQVRCPAAHQRYRVRPVQGVQVQDSAQGPETAAPGRD